MPLTCVNFTGGLANQKERSFWRINVESLIRALIGICKLLLKCHLLSQNHHSALPK